MKAKLFFLIAFILIGAVSCQPVQVVKDMDVELKPFYRGKYNSTFQYTWNLDVLKAFYDVGHEECLYKNVNVKVINDEKTIFSSLRECEVYIPTPDSLIKNIGEYYNQISRQTNHYGIWNDNVWCRLQNGIGL